MNPQQIAAIVQRELNNGLTRIQDKTYYRGIVVAATGNRANIKLEGAEYPVQNVICLESYQPKVDDQVLVLSIGRSGANYVALGKIELAYTNRPVYDMKVYNNNATWTKPEGLKYIIIEGVGGGGGGGGSSNQTGGLRVGGGGAAGGYFKKKILASELPTTVAITVGNAGSGGSANTGNGSNGGDTSFGSFATGKGGLGGENGGGVAATSGNLGGIATGGDINIAGGGGAPAGTIDNQGDLDGLRVHLRTGDGGSSHLGLAGKSDGYSGPARPGTGYGAGGGGGLNYQNPYAGGAGSKGVLIVNEYF